MRIEKSLVTALVCALAINGSTQTITNTNTKSSELASTTKQLHYTGDTFGRVAVHMTWTEWPWNPSMDKHFRALEQQLVKSNLTAKVRNGANPLDALKPFRDDVWNHPGQADKVFRWAVAASIVEDAAKNSAQKRPVDTINIWYGIYPVMYHIQHWNSFLSIDLFRIIYEAKNAPKPPHSYVFDRYMMTALLKGGGTYLNASNVAAVDGMLTRLWRANPKDTEVESWRITRFIGSPWGQYKWAKIAIERAEQAVKKYPLNKDWIYILANANIGYYGLDVWKHKSFGDVALKNYQKYLQESGPNGKYRRQSLDGIQSVKRGVQFRAKYPTRQYFIEHIKRKKSE